jgi:hypothetical protein
MGTGVYTINLKLTQNDIKDCNSWLIDLGDVRESARVYINDQFIGCAWAVPYLLQFNGILKPGRQHHSYRGDQSACKQDSRSRQKRL